MSTHVARANSVYFAGQVDYRTAFSSEVKASGLVEKAVVLAAPRRLECLRAAERAVWGTRLPQHDTYEKYALQVHISR